jgi:hypothetical protein
VLPNVLPLSVKFVFFKVSLYSIQKHSSLSDVALQDKRVLQELCVVGGWSESLTLYTQPPINLKFPAPCILSSFQSPSYSLPSHLYTPLPDRIITFGTSSSPSASRSGFWSYSPSAQQHDRERARKTHCDSAVRQPPGQRRKAPALALGPASCIPLNARDEGARMRLLNLIYALAAWHTTAVLTQGAVDGG